jgi:hypothetical protein
MRHTIYITTVIPAQAGIQSVVAGELVDAVRYSVWIPACAGMTAPYAMTVLPFTRSLALSA